MGYSQFSHSLPVAAEVNLMHAQIPASRLCFLTDDLQERAFVLQTENNELEGSNKLERRSVETAHSESFSSGVAQIEPQ